MPFDPNDYDVEAVGSAAVDALMAAANQAGMRTALGLGTLATQSGTFSGVSSGTNTGDQDLSSYLTSSAAASTYLSQLDAANDYLTIADASTDYQPSSSELSALAALTGTAFGRALIELANAAALRSAAGLGTLATQNGTFSGTSSGTNTGDQNLSGLQPLDSDLTAIAALTTTSFGRALLELVDAAALRTAAGLGTLATQNGTFSGTSSGTNTGDQTTITGNAGTATALQNTRNIAITGDLAWNVNFNGSADATSSGTIVNDAVTYAKMQNVSAASKILGRGDSGSGDVEEITLGSGLTMTGTTLSASGGGGGAGTKTIARWFPMNNEPPASNFATLDTRNGHPVLDFDTTTQETACFRGVLPQGTVLTSGVTVFLQCSLTSATSGTVGWDVSFERVNASLDIDADNFGTAQVITATTVPGTSGQTLVMSVNFSQAQLPTSLAAGDQYRLRIRRDVANDTAAGDAELLAAWLETQ